MGIGDGGSGIGDWGLGPIPNPQSPIPNPQSPTLKQKKNLDLNLIILLNILNNYNSSIKYIKYNNLKLKQYLINIIYLKNFDFKLAKIYLICS